MTAAVKELRLTMRVSNNRVRARREAMGLSAKAAAARAGIAHTTWCDYEGLRRSPYGRLPGFGGRIGWKPAAETIATALGVTVEWLWPETVLAVTNPTVVHEIDAADLRPQLTAAQLRALPESAESSAIEAEDRESMKLLLDGLPDRERQAVEMRFGMDDGHEKTFVEIGAALGVCSGRAKQVVERGLGRIKRWTRITETGRELRGDRGREAAE